MDKVKDNPIFNKFIRGNGTIEDTVVETYFGLIEGVTYDFEDQFLRIRIDNGATNIEVRISKEDYITMKDKIMKIDNES